MFIFKYPFLIYLCIHTYCTNSIYLLEILRGGFFLFKMFKPTLSHNTVNLAAMKQPEVILISILLENL